MPYEINRTELVWPGKYDETGKRSEIAPVSLPFQVIERVNESRATREASKARGLTLFDIWEGDTAETFEAGWRNKLIWGDNKLIMSSLLDQFSGKIDLVYIDPPFATGADFSLTVNIGDSGEQVYKEQSLIEEKAYRDTWGAGLESYLAMMSDRLYLIRDLMSPEGSIFVHCDWHVGHYLRAILDETFGQGQFMNELVWYYYNKFQGNVNRFASDHDVIFWYRKGEKYKFRALKEKRLEGKVQQLKRAWDKEKGAIVNVKGPDGKVLYQETDERTVDDVWRLSMLQPADRTENLGYPTQKPESVLQRIIEACSEPGDLIADFFAGSGTAAAVAEKLGRRWIAADLGRFAVHITRKRLLNIPGCKPFEVLNLGKYERKYWQVATFGEDLDDDGVISLYEYVAFILKLYVASPAAGMQHLHGKKGRAFVHVGAVDSPVTINEIAACIEECVALKAKELHILGWEWEMGLHDPMEDQAAARGVHLVLRQIPREVMEQQVASKGEVEFFELAYLDVEVSATRRQHEVVVELKNFVIPNPELVPQNVREKIQKWSDYVDYWAVDWNFSEDTFHQGWVTYRTRKDRSLKLESDPHTYEEPGEYAVMVKVIDIFGNDTSKICQVKVS
jgi:adenine-specific DNA-methyltransferase